MPGPSPSRKKKTARFWWGSDEPVPAFFYLTILPAILIIPAALPAPGSSAVPAISSDPDLPLTLNAVRMLVLVTFVWLWAYYSMMGHQVLLDIFPTLDKEQAKRTAERSLYNTLEHGVPFLIVMWIHGLFVDLDTAVNLGWVYVAFTFVYGIAYASYGRFSGHVEVATHPRYVISHYLFFSVAFSAIGNTSFHHMLPGSYILRSLTLLGLNLLGLVGWVLPTGLLTAWMNARANRWKEHTSEEDEEEEALGIAGDGEEGEPALSGRV